MWGLNMIETNQNLKLKICNVCQVGKPDTHEHYEELKNTCRKCRNKKIKESRERKKKEDIVLFKCDEMAKSAYARIFAPSRAYKKSYRNLDRPFEFDGICGLREFLYENFYNDIEELINAGDRPSIDRIDTNIGYTPDNIRILSHKENTLLGVDKVKKRVKMTTPNNEEIIFDSVTECVVYLGYNRRETSRINFWARGVLNIYKKPEGYTFEYLN